MFLGFKVAKKKARTCRKLSPRASFEVNMNIKFESYLQFYELPKLKGDPKIPEKLFGQFRSN